MREFPKIRGTCLGVPVTRMLGLGVYIRVPQLMGTTIEGRWI